ncbi:MAG: ACP S-malonyltransferase, partial [Planctomycetota bacterium]
NVTGQPVESPEEVRRLLAQQVTHPVRWRDCMGWVIGQGVRQFYEVGPGHVLRGLLKRIDPSCTCAAVNNEADVRAYAETSGPVPRHERKEP